MRRFCFPRITVENTVTDADEMEHVITSLFCPKAIEELRAKTCLVRKTCFGDNNTVDIFDM